MELLDTLCDAMKGFELAYVNITGTSTWEWVKKGSTVIDEKFKVPRAEAKEREKEIAHYCGSLIEEYEEELSDFIQKPDPEGPSKCFQFSFSSEFCTSLWLQVRGVVNKCTYVVGIWTLLNVCNDVGC